MRIPRILTLAAATALLAVPAGVASAQSSGGQVTVVHGVPGLTVDVYANGDVLLEDFAPGTVTDPVALPAGSYDIAVRPADAAADSDPAISGTAEVTDGLDASVVAHLDADANPTLSVFANDTSQLDAGQARLTVRHTAAAPAVDVLADGDVLVPDLANPSEAVAAVPAGSYDVAINAAGTDTEVTAVPGFELPEGANTIVYAIGDLEGGSFDLLVQSISGLHGAPGGVPAGSAGLADTGDGAVALAGLLVLAGVALGVRRRVTAG